ADCHTPHAEEMTHADCLACHKPHSPKAVNYADGIPNNYCACCHEDVGNALASSKKAHSEMSCIECHESEHMAVTQCDGCHDADLHGATMHERYPLCLDCHNNPHALAE
ncbi:MAG: cytochrome C, partial [Thermodesulfobacteriota bacterium]|nr:cytochrome C [Thermodesulfobacteriota bacterium]